MNVYVKGFASGFFLCLCIITLNASTSQPTDQKIELIQRLDEIQEKIDFNYNVLNKHLVRIMAYGVKVKEGYIDGVRQPVECAQKNNR